MYNTELDKKAPDARFLSYLPPPPLGGDHPTYILLGFSAALAP